MPRFFFSVVETSGSFGSTLSRIMGNEFDASETEAFEDIPYPASLPGFLIQNAAPDAPPCVSHASAVSDRYRPSAMRTWAARSLRRKQTF